MTHTNSIEIISSSNPCSDSIYDDVDHLTLLDFINADLDARRKAGIGGSFVVGVRGDQWEHSGEYYQRNYPNSFSRDPKIDRWYEAVTTWMPADAEKWWLDQFKTNRYLESMSQEWWRQRTRNFIVARDKDTAKPVGAVALTIVYMDERDIHTGVGDHDKLLNPFYHEIRGLVVDESYRGKGIGQKLILKALDEAMASDIDKATVAVTTNKYAASLFEKMKAVSQPSNAKGFPDHGVHYADYYNEYLCWQRLHEFYLNVPRQCSGEKPPCDICPKTHEIAWWWPTDNKTLLTAQLGNLATNIDIA